MAIYDTTYNQTDLTGNNIEKSLEDIEKALQISSYAHEYTRLELEGVRSGFQKEELLEKLESYRETYLSARNYMEIHYPERLEKLEQELICQKRELFPFSA